MEFDASINTGNIVTGIGVLITVATFMYQNWRANDLRKTEIYQRMEFASNDLFGFEATNSKVLERYRDIRPDSKKFSDLELSILNNYAMIEERGPSNVDQSPAFIKAVREMEEEIRVVRKYYEKTLNMFEVATRFRRGRIVEDEVFGSWVIWYYETCREWAFRWMWPDLRKNYLPELRKVFDFPAGYFDFGSDDEVKHDQMRRDFFTHVARLLRCRVIAEWLDRADQDAASMLKRAAKQGVDTYPRWVLRDHPLPEFLERRYSPVHHPISGTLGQRGEVSDSKEA